MMSRTSSFSERSDQFELRQRAVVEVRWATARDARIEELASVRRCTRVATVRAEAARRYRRCTGFASSASLATGVGLDPTRAGVVVTNVASVAGTAVTRATLASGASVTAASASRRGCRLAVVAAAAALGQQQSDSDARRKKTKLFCF